MMTFDANLILLYVQSVENSTSFYSELLHAKPIHSEANYVMFLLKSGLRLGLWAKNDAMPEPTCLGGGTELALHVDKDQIIDELYQTYQHKNITIIQPPTVMDFGYTFVVCDPDNHRIRFFCKRMS